MKTIRAIRFFNTYEPVTSLYRDLVPHLAASGAAVEIVISDAEYRSGRDFSEFDSMPNVRVRRIRTPIFRQARGLKSKLVISANYFLKSSIYLLSGRKSALNVFLTQPPMLSLVGWAAAALRGQRYTCVIMDLQPDMSVALGLVKRDALVTRMAARINRAILRRAEKVIVIGRCMQDVLVRAGIDEQRIVCIPNWADETSIKPIAPAQNRLRQDLGWGERTVIAYVGNIGLPQHFDDFLLVAERLKHRSDVLFAFIGEGAVRGRIAEQIDARGLRNVEMHPFLHTKYSLAEILAGPDVHFVTLREACSGLAVPSKTYGVLAAGRPLVYQGHRFAEVGCLVEENELGGVCGSGETDLLAELFERLLDSAEFRAAAGARARRLAENGLSKATSVRRYEEVLTGAGGRSGSE